MKDTLTADQLAAVNRFAAHYGRTWKSRLRDCWERGGYYPDAVSGDDCALLQQVRNTAGPAWLVRYVVRKAPKTLMVIYVAAENDIRLTVLGLSRRGRPDGSGVGLTCTSWTQMLATIRPQDDCRVVVRGA